MARFYFQPNVPDATFEDFEHLEHAYLDAARQVAARSARAFLNAEAAEGRSCQCCCVSIASSAGLAAAVVLPEIVVDVRAMETDVVGWGEQNLSSANASSRS